MHTWIDDLRHEDLLPRLKAGLRLVQAGSAAVAPLLEALRHEVMEVRWRAAVALGLIGDARAIPGLLDACYDDVYDVQISAVWSIGVIGEPSAFESVIHVLNDDDEAIVTAVAFALLALDRPRAEALFNDLLHGPNERKRRAAHTALVKLQYT